MKVDIGRQKPTYAFIYLIKFKEVQDMDEQCIGICVGGTDTNN